MKVYTNVNLGESFEKLKNSLIQAEKTFQSGSTAFALGMMTGAVKDRLRDCTDIDMTALSAAIVGESSDDLKDVLQPFFE